MNFTVRWESDAKVERHRVWAVAADPAAMRKAAEQAEILLAGNPEQLGSHMSEGLRKLVISPIAVYFTIDHDDRLVQIENVELLAGHEHP